MAGAGYKLFNTGDVLTAAQVNTYLQEQVVMVFANAAARTTALSSVLSEGMVSYLKDTNATEVYDGSTWVSIGSSGDITGVTAGTGLTGGGASGSVTLNFDVANYGGGSYAAGKNKIINGDFLINQRNFSSSTTTGAYNFDRWQQVFSGGSQTISPQTFTAGTAPVSGYEGKTFCRIVSASQSANGDYSAQTQKMESVRTFAGQTVTVSFWAKASTGTPNIGISGLQNFGTGGSPSANVIVTGTVQAITSSWARYSATLTVPSISGKTIGSNNDDHFRADIWTSVGTTISGLGYPAVGLQNVTIDIWGVQVEAGSTATAFQTATGTLQGELAACQRYFQRIVNGAQATNDEVGAGQCYSTSQAAVLIPFLVDMRTTAAMSISSATHFALYTSTLSTKTGASAAFNFPSAKRTRLDITLGTTDLVAGNATHAICISASGYIDASAEL